MAFLLDLLEISFNAFLFDVKVFFEYYIPTKWDEYFHIA